MKKIGPTSQAESFQKLDGRGIAARRLKEIEYELIAAIGGRDVATPQQRILIEGLAVRVLRIRMFVVKFVNEGRLTESTEKRLSLHLSAIAKELQILGLERRAKDIPTLNEYLSGK